MIMCFILPEVVWPLILNPIVSKQPQKLLIHSLQGTEANYFSLQFDTYQTLIYDDGIACTATLLEKPFDNGPLHEDSCVLALK